MDLTKMKLQKLDADVKLSHCLLYVFYGLKSKSMVLILWNGILDKTLVEKSIC